MVPRLTAQAVAFGREQNADLLWAVLQGQTATQMAPEVARQLPTYSENIKVAIRPDTMWEADNTARIQERFTQWLAG